MKDTRLTGLSLWSEFQPDRRIDFNGFLWVHDGGNVAFDPMPLDDAQTEIVATSGGVRWVLLTNADHWRATDAFRERFGARVAAPAAERGRLGARAERVDAWFAPDAPLPATLEIDVHWLRGGKSPAEAAFYLRPLRAVLFGDLVRSHVTGQLRLLPDDKLADPALARRDVLALRELNLEAILLGDGDSLLCGARTAWLDFLRALGSPR